MTKMPQPNHPDFIAYQRLQQQIKALADRWVRAWGDYGYRGGASNVRFSEAYGAGAHPFGEEICFYASYVDGVGRQGSMSSRYLDDDSTLEADSRAWYEADKAERAERSNRLSALERSPDVAAYRALTAQQWGDNCVRYPFTS